jgi:hypothetical protein
LDVETALEGFPWLRCVNALLGTLLVASGAGTLNQYFWFGKREIIEPDPCIPKATALRACQVE